MYTKDKKLLKAKPPLKWAGGKRWLLPHLTPIWHKHQSRRLVEPLCGGLAVALGLLPEKALLNNINAYAINFYQWLKVGLKSQLHMQNDRAIYYRLRKQFNELITKGQGTSKEAAELFYYLNRTGYNGLCRFNKQGKFNVTFGQYKTINYLVDFLAYQEIFSNWEFTAGDFEYINILANDFIYAGPPYDVA